MTAGFAGTGPVGPGGEWSPDDTGRSGPIARTGSWPAAPTTGFPAVPPMSAPPLAAPPRPGRGRSGLAVLVAVLALLVVVQGVFLVSVYQRLGDTRHRLDSVSAADDKRLTGLEGRVHSLEQQAAKALDSSAVAAAILPSVFRIDVDEGSGTAFAIGKAPGGGTDLLTNYHVVEGMWGRGERTASVQHDNQRFPVKIVQVDQDNDLALLHADQKFPATVAAPATVAPGTPIVLIGAPLGLSQSVTTGVVSAIRDDIPGDAGKTFIQFDAAINPGNSGGPVVDAQKQVVGVARAKVNAEGIGLAIPIAVACHSFSGIC
jgi:putative serine protease PepD